MALKTAAACTGQCTMASMTTLMGYSNQKAVICRPQVAQAANLQNRWLIRARPGARSLRNVKCV